MLLNSIEGSFDKIDLLKHYNLTEYNLNFLLNNYNLQLLEAFNINLNSGTFIIKDNLLAIIQTYGLDAWNHYILLTGGPPALLLNLTIL